MEMLLLMVLVASAIALLGANRFSGAATPEAPPATRVWMEECVPVRVSRR